jgi:aspartate/methionine/tyrosine aminotransferase
MITCVSSMSQAAAIAALSGPQDCIATMRDAYEQRRDRVVGILAQAGISPVVPDGAFYLMYPLAEGADSRAAAIDLIDHGVAVAPGTAFGEVDRSHFRISLASGESTLIEAMRRLLAWHEATEGGRRLSRHP